MESGCPIRRTKNKENSKNNNSLTQKALNLCGVKRIHDCGSGKEGYINHQQKVITKLGGRGSTKNLGFIKKRKNRG